MVLIHKAMAHKIITIFISLSTLFFTRSSLYAGNKIDKWPDFEISTVSVGSQGTKVVKVWGKAGSVNSAIEQAKKNAIYACILKGLPDSKNAMMTPPLCTDLDKISLFKSSIEKLINNDYSRYLSFLTDNVPSGADLRKVKGGYKVAVYLQINYDLLRKKLEHDGIIESLNSFF